MERPDAQRVDAGTDAGMPRMPGTVDPTYASEGHVELAGGTITLLLEHADGVVAAHGSSLTLVDDQGTIVRREGLVNVQTIQSVAPLPTGGFLVLAESTFASSPLLLRLDAELVRDDTFAVESGALDDLGPRGSIAVAPDAIWVAGTRDTGAASELVVRRLSDEGQLDRSFGVDGTAVAPLTDIEVRGPVRVLEDGGIAVLGTQSFTPCVAVFEADGTPRSAFGDGGVVVLDALGPRYPRALEVDASGRLLVMGMSGDRIQVARLESTGALDATFGTAGIATASVTRPSSSQYSESLEARALAVQPDGGLVVVSTLDVDEPRDGTEDDSHLVLVRFDADGGIDSAFGMDGVSRLDVDPTVARTRTWSTGAVVRDGRLVVGGEHLRGSSWLPFVAGIAL